MNSPNYPHMYPTNIECVWHIRTSVGKRVKLTIHEFDLESSHGEDSGCLYDKLAVYGGPDRNSPKLVELCSKQTKQSVVTSQGNNMLIAFHSDVSVSGTGFHADYVTEQGGT